MDLFNILKKVTEIGRNLHDEKISLKNMAKMTFCTGNKGTLIFADNNGIHRGLMLKEKFRVMVTAMYTSNNPNFGKFDQIIGN